MCLERTLCAPQRRQSWRDTLSSGVTAMMATEQAGSPVLNRGGLAIDLRSRLVTVDGREIQLSPKEYDLLTLLTRNHGKVMTHRQIMTQVWGYAGDPCG